MITIGADPEVFLKDKDGVHRSSIGKIGGSKDVPRPMKGLAEGFFVQEDNVAAEFNIPPCTTAVSFSANIARGIKYLEKLAKAHNLVVDIVPAVHFDPKEFYDPKALELGCDPDFNAWTDAPNPRPVPPPTLRTAAGHVHIGFPVTGKNDVLDLIKLLDLRVSIPLVLKYPLTERRTLYGKAGAYRPTPYGCEYRTPDNYWLADKSSRMWMFKTVYNTVVDLLNDRRQYGSKSLMFEEVNQFRSMICKAINEGDVKTAEQVMYIFDIQPMKDGEDVETKAIKPKATTKAYGGLQVNQVIMDDVRLDEAPAIQARAADAAAIPVAEDINIPFEPPRGLRQHLERDPAIAPPPPAPEPHARYDPAILQGMVREFEAAMRQQREQQRVAAQQRMQAEEQAQRAPRLPRAGERRGQYNPPAWLDELLPPDPRPMDNNF